jgi:hypothetical protein
VVGRSTASGWFRLEGVNATPTRVQHDGFSGRHTGEAGGREGRNQPETSWPGSWVAMRKESQVKGEIRLGEEDERGEGKRERLKVANNQ